MIEPCRVIHGSFAPSVSGPDAVRALTLLLRPATWRSGTAPAALESALSRRLDDREVLVVDSGRNALRLVLQAVGVRAGDEVLLQAFTCVSVPGPVLWVGARPVYVDIDPATFNLDLVDLRQKISPRAKALIIQHTFGLPADLDALLALARSHHLAVIEDCAHALGSTYHGRPVGTFGDAAIFSFGRDKVISSVGGGALVLRKKKVPRGPRGPFAGLEIGNPEKSRGDLGATLRDWKLEMPPRWWVARQLLHTALAPTIRSTYYCGGRFALRAALRLNVLSRALTNQEKRGGPPPRRPSRLANALARRALDQLDRLDAFREHRQTLALHYTESLADVPGITLPTTPSDRTHGFLRYAVRVPDREVLQAAARRQHIVLGDTWYDLAVAPKDTDLRALGYQQGSCPRAEEAARQVINLPTSPTLTIPDADRVLRVVRSTLSPIS